MNEIKLINTKDLIQAKIEDKNYDGEGNDFILCKYKEKIFPGYCHYDKNETVLLFSKEYNDEIQKYNELIDLFDKDKIAYRLEEDDFSKIIIINNVYFKIVSELNESQNPSPKAIFLAGPSGAGKSTISKELLPSDWEIINVDIEYEKLLQKANIGTDIKDFDQEKLSKAGELMSQARKATDNVFNQFSKDGKNIIIDGTGASSKTLLNKKSQLESLGYNTFMVMVWSTPYTALERNQNRERSLKPFIVLKTWRDVVKNIEIYKNEFNNTFVLINNDPNGKMEFDYEYIKQQFPSQSSGKTYTPEESAKLNKDREQLKSDITNLLSSIPQFDSIDDAKFKIEQFIENKLNEIKLVNPKKLKEEGYIYYENINDWILWEKDSFESKGDDDTHIYGKLFGKNYKGEEYGTYIQMEYYYDKDEDINWDIDEGIESMDINDIQKLHLNESLLTKEFWKKNLNEVKLVKPLLYTKNIKNDLETWVLDNGWYGELLPEPYDNLISFIAIGQYDVEELETYFNNRNIPYELDKGSRFNIYYVDKKWFKEKTSSNLDEIKMVPPNRILLKKFGNVSYTFRTNEDFFVVFKSELLDGTVRFKDDNSKDNTLIPFLDSKKIPYKIDDEISYESSTILVDAKYFITPDKINEIKLIPNDTYREIIDLNRKIISILSFRIDDFTYDEWYDEYQSEMEHYVEGGMSGNFKDIKSEDYSLLLNWQRNFYKELKNFHDTEGEITMDEGIFTKDFWKENLFEVRNVNLPLINSILELCDKIVIKTKAQHKGISYSNMLDTLLSIFYEIIWIHGIYPNPNNSDNHPSTTISDLYNIPMDELKKLYKQLIDVNEKIDIEINNNPKAIETPYNLFNEIKLIKSDKKYNDILNLVNQIGLLIENNINIMIDEENNQLKKSFIPLINNFLRCFNITDGPEHDRYGGEWKTLDLLSKDINNPQIIEFLNNIENKWIINEIKLKLENSYNELYSAIENKKSLDEVKLVSQSKIDKKQIVKEFLKYCVKELNLKENCKIKLTSDKSKTSTYAHYSPSDNEIVVYIKNRSLGDILRSICHELVHHKQNQNGELNPESGNTGSEQENEANSKAGIILRDFGKQYPQIFESKKSNKNILSEIKMIPPNRILLKRDYDEDYFFIVSNIKWLVFKNELLHDEFVEFWEEENLIEFLNSKKIPYKVNKSGVIQINPKYFVAPDNLNEVKLLKQNTIEWSDILIPLKNKLPKSLNPRIEISKYKKIHNNKIIGKAKLYITIKNIEFVIQPYFESFYNITKAQKDKRLKFDIYDDNYNVSLSDIKLEDIPKKLKELIIKIKDNNLNEIKLLKNPNLPLVDTSKIQTIYDLIHWKSSIPGIWEISKFFPNNFPPNIRRKIEREWVQKNTEIITEFTPIFLEKMYNEHHDKKLEFDGKIGSPLRNKKYSILGKLSYPFDSGNQKLDPITNHINIKTLNSITNYLGVKIIDFYKIYIWDEYYRLKSINLYMFYYNNIPLIYIPKLQHLDDKYVGIYSPNGYISIKGINSIIKNNDWDYFKEVLEINKPINEVKLVNNKLLDDIKNLIKDIHSKIDIFDRSLESVLTKYGFWEDNFNLRNLSYKDMKSFYNELLIVNNALDKKRKNNTINPKPYKIFTKQWWNNLIK